MEEEKNLKKEIEAILFAAGRMVELDEIARLCKADKNDVGPFLKELKADYERSDSPMFLIQEGNGWKMTVREKYLGVIREVATHTELNKALLETLAIVAWKQPVMQADVVKIRGSTCYEHISALVDMGFLTKIKHGRSFVLKPSTRFFDYFDLPSKEAVKEVFKDIELTDSEKRKQLGEILGEQQKKIDDNHGQQTDGSVEVYNSAENKEIPLEKAEEEMETEKFGKLEVYDEKNTEESESSDKEAEENSDEENEIIEEKEILEDKEENKETEEESAEEKQKDKDYEELSSKIKTISEKKKSLPQELKEFAEIKDEEKEEADDEESNDEEDLH
jgi:segregation and condensation protein B